MSKNGLIIFDEGNENFPGETWRSSKEIKKGILKVYTIFKTT